MKILQIVLCILSCLFVAAAFLFGALYGLLWFFILAACAGLCAALMVLVKKKNTPVPPPPPDFMNTEAENRDLNERREEWKEEHRDE